MHSLPEFSFPIDGQLEQEILGACFSENRTHIANARAVLDPNEFGLEDHRRVFQSLCRLADLGEPLTATRVHADMNARMQPITLGYLIEYEGPGWALDKNLRRAKDLACRRTLIVRSQEIM